MPMILAPGKLRRKVVMNLRTRLERELLLALSSVLFWETLFQGKKKKKKRTKSECLATCSYKVFPFYDIVTCMAKHSLDCQVEVPQCSLTPWVINESCSNRKKIILICTYIFRICPYCEVFLESLSF